MLRTKFKYWAYAPLIIALGLIILLYVFVILLSNHLPVYGYIIITGLLILIVWLIFIELKNKVVTVTIEDDVVSSAKFLGWGTRTTIQMSEITGYKTCIVPREWDSTEVLYLIADNKKVIRLSEFYHLNYFDLKHFFITRFKNLGQEGYNLFL